MICSELQLKCRIADPTFETPVYLYAFQVAIDTATPVDDASSSGNFMMNGAEAFGAYPGPIRSYGRMYGSLDFDDVSIYCFGLCLDITGVADLVIFLIYF